MTADDRTASDEPNLQPAGLMMRRRAWLAALGSVGMIGPWPGRAAPAAPADAPRSPIATGWVHAIAAFTEPAYPAGYTHFGYVDPQAPKGGTLHLGNPDRRTSFDKFNPFTTRGNAPAALSLFMFESLAMLGADEPMTAYGLLAQEMKVEPDLSAVTFRLHPRARFHDGSPVHAEDVLHSFQTLTGPEVAPAYPVVYGALGKAVVVDERTIRFELRDRSVDTVFTAAGLSVFSRRWGLNADGTRKRFDELVTEYPITSGPYTITRAESGRRLELQRNPDYWARDLPVRRGWFNFDRIVYRYYKDRAVQMEAFKAGEFDLLKEYSARRWVRQHAGPKWDDGRIRKQRLATKMGQGMQAYRYNLRRPLMADIRVREALTLAYDFEWVNVLGTFKRAHSMFNNTDFAATGLPSPAELKLLEPHRAELPPAVFGPAYVPPSTVGGPNALRDNLKRARDLFGQAGWKVDADGVMRNAQGQAYEFEYLTPEEGAARNVAAWTQNLAKIGVALKVRQVDYALFNKRLEVFDFDMTAIVAGDFTLPAASDYQASWTTKAADQTDSGAYSGLKLRALDDLIEQLARAVTIEELRTAARAIDRVIMHSQPFMPELYVADEPISWWNRFGMPERVPGYFSADSAISPYPAWPLMTWWLRDPAARRQG